MAFEFGGMHVCKWNFWPLMFHCDTISPYGLTNLAFAKVMPPPGIGAILTCLYPGDAEAMPPTF